MVRHKLLTLCALSGVALLALAGCGDAATARATWHGARPAAAQGRSGTGPVDNTPGRPGTKASPHSKPRSEEHTSELQSRRDLVCRLLLEKKKKKKKHTKHICKQD